MKLEQYDVEISKNHLTYEFWSEGPNGKIKKVIIYEELEAIDNKLYNLAFGDWIESEHRIDDKIKSNNKDHEKVLATVAGTIINFTERHPDAKIFVTGSTESRTRLYQMGVASILNEIEVMFVVKGLIEGKWEFFTKNKAYSAFLLCRK